MLCILLRQLFKSSIWSHWQISYSQSIFGSRLVEETNTNNSKLDKDSLLNLEISFRSFLSQFFETTSLTNVTFSINS